VKWVVSTHKHHSQTASRRGFALTTVGGRENSPVTEGIGPLAVVVGLMLATVLLVGVGERIRRPYPVLVLLLGVVMALVPGIPELRINPDLILPIFLPPLIYAAAQRSSWSMLWGHRKAIVWLAGVLVLVTVAAIAYTAYLVVPGVSVAAALALGALVAPPDPVAAEAVAGPLRLPRRLVTILQTEGLCNDATALVVYGVAVRDVLGGRYSIPEAVGLFCYEAAIAVGVGLAVAWLARRLLTRITGTSARSGLTLVVPFATYLIADAAGASGVLAVLAVGLALGRPQDEETGVSDRLIGGAFWDTLELLITGLAFGLIGLELREVLNSHINLAAAVRHAAVICLVIVGVRFAWMVAGGAISRRGDADPDLTSRGWREDVVLASCGMRGLATIALALALPLATPARGELLIAAFAVIAVTLVLPGLGLPALVRVLGVQAEADAEQAATRPLVVRAGHAALARLRELDAAEDLPTEVAEILRSNQQALVAALGDEPLTGDYKDQVAALAERTRQIRRIQREMNEAARREILAARAEPGIDPEAADQVLRRLDVRSIRIR
jgi:CPA1 family monovalent cation:H+ antiporter